MDQHEALTEVDLEAFCEWHDKLRRRCIKATFDEHGPDAGYGRVLVWQPYGHILLTPNGLQESAPRWTLYRTVAGLMIEDEVGGTEQSHGPLVTMEQALTVVEILIKEHTRALIDAIPILQVDLSGTNGTLSGVFGRT
jgi:hypothetical protein